MVVVEVFFYVGGSRYTETTSSILLVLFMFLIFVYTFMMVDSYGVEFLDEIGIEDYFLLCGFIGGMELLQVI